VNWDQIANHVTPYIVRVETPSGHGTGFVCLHNHDKSFCGIATASHVVAYADRWQQPIRIHHQPSGVIAFVSEEMRVIYNDPDTDSAVILVPSTELDLPQDPIPLLPTDTPLPIGTEVGWLGYPGLVSQTLCFFSGTISARQEGRHAYLIDGVAINGVSGGPVVYSTPTDGVRIIGTISAYVANRATGESLPGLAVAQDVSHFHDTIAQINSIDDARQQQEQDTQPPPSS